MSKSKKTEHVPRILFKQNGSKRRKIIAPSMEEMMKLMECPICLQAMAGVRIYQCKNGHSLCGYCKDKLKSCPTCRARNINIRSIGMESISDTFTFNCKNSLCEATLKGSEMNDHLKVCEYRPFQCFETKSKRCKGELVDISEFFDHLKKVHQIRQHRMNSNAITVNYKFTNFENTRWYLSCVEYDGRIFMFSKEIKGSNLYLWMTLIGRETEANAYTYQVKILDPNSTSKERSVQSNLHMHAHYFVKLSDAEETGDVFSMSTKQLESFCCKKENKYLCKIIYEIHKI